MNDSSITITQHGSVSFNGPDAVALYRAAMLRSSIGLYMKTGLIPTRGLTITRMLTAAGQITGHKYKRTQADAAMHDLQVWVETMKAALPINQD